MEFTGQLKEWWDKLLSPEDKIQINLAVKTESNESICVTTLLYDYYICIFQPCLVIGGIETCFFLNSALG